ncbi:DUF29 domain-containing protein [Lyngbya confervoides]|uniref:DUF29 domain-containing protein n=1 Tax=Lyngbya confervoides BDU141951 TaxID=1574623 RepID=A0ABD4TBH6_9CYAN|nr:DUF29 domain-containing protein [Lyngbya confervoides]MCM1985255.1 DUF29 domain-containing protein [Lyngbya confervoides BDU141951]
MKFSAYDRDYHQWLEAQIRAIQTAQFHQLDTHHLIEELKAVAKRDKRDLGFHLKRMLYYQLRWQCHPERRKFPRLRPGPRYGIWHSTIQDSREHIRRILADSPSLRDHLEAILAQEYAQARLDVAQTEGVRPAIFPRTCKWSLQDLLAEDQD